MGQNVEWRKRRVENTSNISKFAFKSEIAFLKEQCYEIFHLQ
jgi:hypothetical protein